MIPPGFFSGANQNPKPTRPTGLGALFQLDVGPMFRSFTLATTQHPVSRAFSLEDSGFLSSEQVRVSLPQFPPHPPKFSGLKTYSLSHPGHPSFCFPEVFPHCLLMFLFFTEQSSTPSPDCHLPQLTCNELKSRSAVPSPCSTYFFAASDFDMSGAFTLVFQPEADFLPLQVLESLPPSIWCFGLQTKL